MRDAVHRLVDHVALGDRAADDLEPRGRVEHAVVAQRAHGETRERPDVGCERPPYEGLPTLPVAP